MFPYLTVLLIVVLIVYAARRSRRRGTAALGIGVASVLLILFAGFRDSRVGTDTGIYVYQFTQVDSLQSALSGDMEVGFLLLNWTAKLVSDSYASLLLLIAAIIVPLYVSTIVRLAKRYETGIYLFVALGVYSFFFNGARQAISAAICFWAIRFILDRRLIPYATAVGLAMLFHKTALVALPLYFLAVPRLRIAGLVGLFAGSLVLAAFLGIFVELTAELLGDRFASYAEEGEGGGRVMGMFLLIQGALLAWLRRFIRDEREIYTRLLNIYLVGLVPVAVSILSSVNPSGLLRLHIYFTAVAVLLWPMVFRHVQGIQQRGMLGFAFVLFTIAFFVTTTSSFSALVPYQLNAELFQ